MILQKIIKNEIAVLCGAIKKRKIEPVVRSCGVSEPPIYMWLERSRKP